MKRTAIAVSLCIGLVPSAALAYDWSVRTTQTETIEANDNLFLRTLPAVGYGSYSTLTANAEALTETSKFDFDGSSNYRKFFGPAADGAPSESLSYNFKGHYETIHKDKFDREFVEASWTQSSAAFALLSDLGVITPTRGFLDRATYTGGIDHSITAQDSVSLLATSTLTSYEPSGGGTPLTDILARGSWRHNFSANVAGNLSSEADMLDFDNASHTHIEIYRNQVGIDTTLSPLLSFRGNVGAVYILTEGGINPLAGSNGLNATSSALLDWIGDATLTYKLLKNTTLAIIASQSTGPSVVGSLFKTDSLSASLRHTINARSTLSFSASAVQSTSTLTTDYVTGSVTYGYRITPDLSADLTYRYQHRFASTGGTTTIDPITGTPTVAGTGAASSNSITLVVSNSFTILPRGN